MPIGAIVISLNPSILFAEEDGQCYPLENNKRMSHPQSHAIIEESIRHNIAQMTSTSKVYIPYILAIIIK